MAALELHHRIYTHAPSAWSAAGGRFERVSRDASNVLPKAALQELDDLLTKLEPEGAAPAFAMRRFESFLCLAVAYRGFDDAQGRNGTLKHARVVRIDPAEPWVNPLPLIAEARAFPIDEADSLGRYLDLLADDETLAIPPLTAASFANVSRQLLHDALAASLATLGRRKAARVQLLDETLEHLALAAAALPPALQRQSSWAVDAADGAPVDVIWSSSGKPLSELSSDGVEQTVTSYLDLLLDSSFDLGPLMSDDGIRAATDLQRFLRKAAVVSPVKKTKMPKKTTTHSDDHELAKLDRQQQAIYQSLRKYIDQRLAAHEVARQESASSAPRVPLAALIAITAVTTALLVLGGQWLWAKFRPPTAAPVVEREEPRTEPAAEPEDATAPRRSPERETLRALIAAAETNGQWAEGLKALSEQHGPVLARVVDTAARAQDVSAGVSRQLAAYGARLQGDGKPLDVAARNALRPLLFEYAVKSNADEQSVDGKLDEIDGALLRETKERLGVRSTATKADDRELQAEVILRWLEVQLQ